MSKRTPYTGTERTMAKFINDYLYSHRGECFSYVQLVSGYLKEQGKQPANEQITDCGDYKNTLQAARKAVHLIDTKFKKAGRKSLFIHNRDGRKVSFGYSKELDFDPLADESTQYHQMRKSALEQLLRYSNGVISEDILCKAAIGKKEKEIIHFETSEDLKNVRLISDLYFAILEKKVVSFHYTNFKSFSADITLSPHYLKEYDRRWYVFGYTDDDKETPRTYAIDRIDSDVEVVENAAWLKPKDGFDYKEYFSDIIGVTHQLDSDGNLYPPIELIFETLNAEVHGMITSLKIHKSQETLRQFDDKTKTPGVIKLTLRTNQQLLEELFKLSIYYKKPAIRIIKPVSLAETIKERAQRIVDLYNKSDAKS